MVRVTTPFGTVLPDRTRGLSNATETGFEVSAVAPATVTELAIGDGGSGMVAAGGDGVVAVVLGVVGLATGAGAGGGGVVKVTVIGVVESPQPSDRQPSTVTLPAVEDVRVNEALPFESVVAEAGLAVALPEIIFT
jgi:hypothetical protein